MSTLNLDVSTNKDEGEVADKDKDEGGDKNKVADDDNDDDSNFMSTQDVLAELDSLDDVLGVDTAEPELEQLRPKQVQYQYCTRG